MLDDLNLDMSKTYIYDGLEYILTGRKAIKHPEQEPQAAIPRRSKRPILVQPEQEPHIMVEIKPAPGDKTMNNIPTLGGEKKWVRYSELFMITDMLEDDE